MSVIQKKDTALAAGATIENVLNGSTFEFARRNSVISIGSVASVALVFVTIIVGATTVLEESEMVVRTAFPVIPDEFYYQDVAAQGDRIVIRVRNGAAVPADIRTLVQIAPLT